MLSILIPANNEGAHIGACLSAVLASEGLERAQIVVAANGCVDETATLARGFAEAARQKGWTLEVLELPALGKMGALNAAEASATYGTRAYLDADVIVDAALLGQIATALSSEIPRYASGQLRLAAAQSWATRAYARIYAQVPFLTHGVPGAGLFAVNAAGRARWGAFPGIISDDTFVRLQFSPTERIGVRAGYDWPLVEGFGALVKVRRRQNAGVAEVAATYPDLLQNDDKATLLPLKKLTMALRDPLGFAVYAGVAMAVKLRPQQSTGWERGR
ncbi:glycosyltransferase family 2 protein [Shimia marina]|uniref:glycosyltransferase family 2 protein n=1 Tax=Shimia marina TaxID=321267 RepID=UPI00071DFC65|nr:glycosyltransferase [Shimia marina]